MEKQYLQIVVHGSSIWCFISYLFTSGMLEFLLLIPERLSERKLDRLCFKCRKAALPGDTAWKNLHIIKNLPPHQLQSALRQLQSLSSVPLQLVWEKECKEDSVLLSPMAVGLQRATTSRPLQNQHSIAANNQLPPSFRFQRWMDSKTGITSPVQLRIAAAVTIFKLYLHS